MPRGLSEVQEARCLRGDGMVEWPDCDDLFRSDAAWRCSDPMLLAIEGASRRTNERPRIQSTGAGTAARLELQTLDLEVERRSFRSLYVQSPKLFRVGLFVLPKLSLDARPAVKELLTNRHQMRSYPPSSGGRAHLPPLASERRIAPTK